MQELNNLFDDLNLDQQQKYGSVWFKPQALLFKNKLFNSIEDCVKTLKENATRIGILPQINFDIKQSKADIPKLQVEANDFLVRLNKDFELDQIVLV